MVRVFVAIDLPQEVKDELFAVQKLLPAARMALVRDFHITLKFLGEITPAKADVVKNCLNRVRFKHFAAALSGVGVFPSESYIRVVWAGIEPEDEAIELQKRVDDALEKDFPKDKSFKPHITLARVKFVGDKELFKQQLQKLQVKKLAFNVDAFKLKKSVLTNNGAVYEDLAVFS